MDTNKTYARSSQVITEGNERGFESLTLRHIVCADVSLGRRSQEKPAKAGFLLCKLYPGSTNKPGEPSIYEVSEKS